MAFNFSAFTGKEDKTAFPKLSSFIGGGGQNRTALSTPKTLDRSRVKSAVRNAKKRMVFPVESTSQRENIHRSARLGITPIDEGPVERFFKPTPKVRIRDVFREIPKEAEKIFFPTRGFTEEELKDADPTFKQKLKALPKLGAEITAGVITLSSLFGDIIARSKTVQKIAETPAGKKLAELGEGQERLIERLFSFAQPKTAEEAKALRIADIGTLFIGEIRVGKSSAMSIARSKNVNIIKNILKKEVVGLNDEAVGVFSKILVNIDNAEDVQKVFNRTNFAIQKSRPATTAMQVAKKAKDSRALSSIVKNIDTVDRDIMKGFVDSVQAGKTPHKDVAFRAQGLADAMKIPEATSGNKALANKFGEILDADRAGLKKKFDIDGEKEGIMSQSQDARAFIKANPKGTVEEFVESQFPPVLRTGKVVGFAKANSSFEGFADDVIKAFPESDIITKTGHKGIDFTKTDLVNVDKELIRLEGDSIEEIFAIVKGDFDTGRPIKIVNELTDEFNKAKPSLPTEATETPSIKQFTKIQKEVPEIVFKNTNDMKIIRSKETGDIVAVKNRAGDSKRLDTPEHRRDKVLQRARGVGVKKSTIAEQKPHKQTERQTQRVSSTRSSQRSPTVAPDILKVSEDPLLASIAQEKIHVISGTPKKKVSVPQPQIDSINNILNVTEMRIKPTTKVGDLTKRDLIKEVQDTIKKQGEKLKDSEIKKIREDNLLGAETIDEIILRKRGIITDKEAIERAKVMAGTMEDVLNIPKGSVPTKEQLTAVSQIVQQEREINKRLIRLADGFGSASTREEKELVKRLGRDFDKLTEGEIINRALEESTLKLRKGEIVLIALKSEIGRSLQGAKQVVDAVDSRMRIMYGKIRKLDELKQQSVIEELSKIHLNNDKEFIKFLDEYNGADLFDKFAEWATAAKLWNPTTHIVNFGGNTARQVFDIGVTSVVSPSTIKADIMGSIVGLDKGIKNALRAMTDEGYASQLSKYIEEGGTAPAIGGKLGKIVRTPFRALGASDEIFRAIGYQRSLYRQASKLSKGNKEQMKKLLERPTLEMMEDATFQSKRLTFQEDMGEIVRKINEARTPANFQSKTAKTASLLLRLNVSFLKTPTNLAKQAVDLSPVGLIKNLPEIKKLTKAGDNEHSRRLLAEAIFGTALTFWAISQAQDGTITGGAPRNKSEKDKFYRENKLPYAIKFDNKWYQYKRVDPFSTILATVSDLVQLKNEENLDVGGVIQSLSNQMEDKTYMRGFSDLMKFMTGEQWERDYVMKSMILGATLPSFLGHAARSIDPNIREAKTITDRIKAQTPFLSTSLPMRVNALGEPIERANKGFNYFFNPIQSAVAEISPITKHLMDIDKTIPVPQSFFKRDGIRYDLSSEVYADYSKQLGKELVIEIEKLMRSSSYMRKSNEDKAEKIEKVRKDIARDWKDNYLKTQKAPITRDELKDALRKRLKNGDITREEAVKKIKNYDKRF